MNRYKCPDCKGYQYTANPNAAGSSCIYCKDGRVILDSELRKIGIVDENGDWNFEEEE